jgi:hypothetical protein
VCKIVNNMRHGTRRYRDIWARRLIGRWDLGRGVVLEHELQIPYDEVLSGGPLRIGEEGVVDVRVKRCG